MFHLRDIGYRGSISAVYIKGAKLGTPIRLCIGRLSAAASVPNYRSAVITPLLSANREGEGEEVVGARELRRYTDGV